MLAVCNMRPVLYSEKMASLKLVLDLTDPSYRNGFPLQIADFFHSRSEQFKYKIPHIKLNRSV